MASPSRQIPPKGISEASVLLEIKRALADLGKENIIQFSIALQEINNRQYTFDQATINAAFGNKTITDIWFTLTVDGAVCTWKQDTAGLYWPIKP